MVSIGSMIAPGASRGLPDRAVAQPPRLVHELVHVVHEPLLLRPHRAEGEDHAGRIDAGSAKWEDLWVESPAILKRMPPGRAGHNVQAGRPEVGGATRSPTSLP